MENASLILVAPFQQVWLALAAQINAWNGTMAAIGATTTLEAGLVRLSKQLGSATSGKPDVRAAFDTLLKDAQARSEQVRKGLSSGLEPVVYPLLIRTWAVVEAASEDLIVRILLNDPVALARSIAFGGTPGLRFEVGSDDYFREIGKRVRSKLFKKGCSLVDTDSAVMRFFGAPMSYPEDRAKIIEEINQVRNCILHRNGIIDAAAASKAPRLSTHLGKRMPASDPIFMACSTLLQDYTLEWLQALANSPYLRKGLKPEARRPLPEGFTD